MNIHRPADIKEAISKKRKLRKIWQTLINKIIIRQQQKKLGGDEIKTRRKTDIQNYLIELT